MDIEFFKKDNIQKKANLDNYDSKDVVYINFTSYRSALQELENLERKFSSFSNIRDKFKGDLKDIKNLETISSQIASDINFYKPFTSNISEQRKNDIISGKATSYIWEDNFDSYRKTIKKSLNDELKSEAERYNYWFNDENNFYTLNQESGKYYKYNSNISYTPLEKKYEITKKEYYEALDNYKNDLVQKNMQEQEEVKENVLRQPSLKGKIIRLFDNHFVIVTNHTIKEEGDSFINEIDFIYYDEFNYDRLSQLKKQKITLQQKEVESSSSNLQTAISQGVKVFTMETLDKLSKVDLLTREELLSNGFEYKEFNDVSYYVKKLSEKEEGAKMIERQSNTIQVNGVQIDLRKLGFDFPLTTDQLQVVQSTADWIDGKNIPADKPHLTLSGYAGTGKTTVGSVILEYAQQSKHRVRVTSTTNKAVKVQKKMYGDRVDVKTLHSLFAIRPDVQIDKFDVKDVDFLRKSSLNELRTNPDKFIDPSKYNIGYGDKLIIDESSMLNDALYEYVTIIADYLGVNILFVGDERQLKPVKKNYISKAFRDVSDKVKLVLSTIVRQGKKNSLLDVVSKLRENQATTTTPLGKTRTSVISEDGKEGIEWVLDSGFNKHIQTIFKSNEYQENPDYAKVVVFQNKTVAKYNSIIRDILGYKKGDEIVTGEILMAYENISKLLNSADYRVVKKENITREFIHPLNPEIKIEAFGTRVSLVDIMDSDITDTVFILNRNNSEVVKEFIAKILRETRAQANNLYSKNNRIAANSVYAKYMTLINSFLTFEELTIPGDFVKGTTRRTVHKKKSIDYGYAITSHKSQGSTYNYAFVDESDFDYIYTLKDADIESVNQAKYVAFSRASQGVIAKTNGKIENNDSFNFQQSKGITEDINIVDGNNSAIDALVEDGIVVKVCK